MDRYLGLRPDGLKDTGLTAEDLAGDPIKAGHLGVNDCQQWVEIRVRAASTLTRRWFIVSLERPRRVDYLENRSVSAYREH